MRVPPLSLVCSPLELSLVAVVLDLLKRAWPLKRLESGLSLERTRPNQWDKPSFGVFAAGLTAAEEGSWLFSGWPGK